VFTKPQFQAVRAARSALASDNGGEAASLLAELLAK
jgi:hypothetical protein